MKAKIVTLSETGEDSTQIRNYIINAYNTWTIQPEYLLIVGNRYQVPFPRYYHAYNVISFSDNYYANVMGDFHNELYHGRLWAADTEQVKTVVAKILGYEKNPYMADSLWFKKGATIVNEFEQGQPPSDSLYWEDARYAIQWMQGAGYVHIDSFSYYLGHDSADVLNAINDGRTYMLYRGIGGGDWIWPFGGIYSNQMTNGFKMPIVVSATCATFEGIGRDWLVAGTPTQPRGIIGFYNATTSLFAAAEMRSALCRGTTASLFGDATTSLGKAAEAGRLEYYAQFQDLIEYHSWILLGDPELKMWTETPKELVVGHNMYFTTGICTANVFVQHNLAPVESALVCVMAKSDSSFYHNGYTDETGHIRFIDTLHIPGDSVYITVTALNFRPFHNARPVLYMNGPYVRLYSFSLLDSLGGNGDRTANPGEDIEVPFVVRNWGNTTAHGVSAVIEKSYPDTNYILYDTLKTIGDIAPYESICVYPDGYNVLIDSTCPDLHEIDLRLRINDSGILTWTSELGFVVHSPIISYDDYHFDGNVKFTPAGANNNLTVELLNTGSCTAFNVAGKISCSDTFLTITDSTADFGNILPDSIGSNGSNAFTVTSDVNAPPCHPISVSIEIVSGVFVDTFDFTIYIGQKDFLLWDPDLNHSSGPIIRDMLVSLDFFGDYTTDFPYGLLSIYKSLFVCAGIYPNNYFIGEIHPAGPEIDNYIQNQGGKAYIEGGDIWYDALTNNGYNFGPLFGIDPEYNSIGLFQGVVGCNGAFSENMSFTYSGEAILIDYIDSTGGAQLLFKKRNSNYGCGVIAGHRTVGISFELASLVDSVPPSTRLALVDSIMDYFAIPPTGITKAQEFGIVPTISLTCHPNPFRRMTDIRYEIPELDNQGISGSAGRASGNQQPDLKIYDVTGRLVRDFSDQLSVIGHPSSVKWDGRDVRGNVLPAGVYFVRLSVSENRLTSKIVLID
jgi:hypothetical protein